MIIGITGSFGSGKTTVANLFKKYNFKVINVDKLYEGIYKKNKSLRNKIKNEFGTINKTKLKKIVFNNSNTRKNGTFFVSQKSSISVKLKRLNKITHPIIIDKIKKEIINTKNKNIVIDVPLLIEAKATHLVDKIIIVKCKKDIQIKRILKKKKYTKEEINNIIKSQMSLKKKLKYADFVVNNNYSINKTKDQIKKILNKIKK